MPLVWLLPHNYPEYSELNQINKKYESITSSNVLEHIEDDVSTINEMRSLLVDKGILILYLPASQMVWTKMDDDVNHFRRYSKKVGWKN